MIFVAFNKNSYEVLFVIMCPDENQILSMFKKIILPSLNCKEEDIDWRIINLSYILLNSNI